MSAAAARHAARTARGRHRVTRATGARSSRRPARRRSSFSNRWLPAPGIDWPRVEMFHLDEYVGLPVDHPASFRRYLLERLIRPTGMRCLPSARWRARCPAGRRRGRPRRLRPVPSTSRSSESARTDISPSTIRPPTSPPSSRTSSSRSTRPAGASRSARAGSRRSRTCRRRRSRCRSARF